MTRLAWCRMDSDDGLGVRGYSSHTAPEHPRVLLPRIGSDGGLRVRRRVSILPWCRGELLGSQWFQTNLLPDRRCGAGAGTGGPEGSGR